jgi:hypothetical protein
MLASPCAYDDVYTHGTKKIDKLCFCCRHLSDDFDHTLWCLPSGLPCLPVQHYGHHFLPSSPPSTQPHICSTNWNVGYHIGHSKVKTCQHTYLLGQQQCKMTRHQIGEEECTAGVKKDSTRTDRIQTEWSSYCR